MTKNYLDMELLRFTTAGSVDDGKSTLIGRLMYDSKSIFEDQLEAIEKSSSQQGLQDVNLALLTDGLKAEREQGITIDVAYRYFATPKRKFIIADTPGHIQYTRNMVTGASTANLALILVDARQGILEQTKRHAYIASLLNIPHLILCVNKMDLVDYSEERYDEIVDEFTAYAAKLGIVDVRTIPISALKGDNVVEHSPNMKWYKGATLLYTLEHIHISSDFNHFDPRLSVQYVIRPHKDEYHDYRGYAGVISSGIFRKGDEVMLLPSGLTSKIKSIDTIEGELEEAFAPLSVSVQLEDDVDLGRGDMIVKPNNIPEVTQDIDATLCWFHPEKLQMNRKYIVRTTTREAKGVIKDIVYKMDIENLHRVDETDIGMNDIARVKMRVTQPLFVDSYEKNRATGNLILIDESSFNTVAACMVM